jgi:hypothetical protein
MEGGLWNAELRKVEAPFLISNSTFIIPVEGAGLGRTLVKGSDQ